MSTNFDSYSFEDFRQTFLVEKDLDQTSPIRMGELSRDLSRINIDAGKTLTRWAKEVSNKVERYVRNFNKKSESQARLRVIPVGDIKTDAAAMIVLDIDGVVAAEASIFDSNKMVIKMSPNVARLVNKGKVRKYFANKDRLTNYLIGVLEVLHDV